MNLDRFRPKTRSELSVQDKTSFILNAKATNALYNTLDAMNTLELKVVSQLKKFGIN